jgi:hypothetical protein
MCSSVLEEVTSIRAAELGATQPPPMNRES